MNREHIIGHLVLLGQLFKQLSEKAAWSGFESGLSEVEYDDMESLIAQAYVHNGWFTGEQVRHALGAWAQELTQEKLEAWTAKYSFTESSEKKVGLIMAGNIPLVGLHDMVSVLLSGHQVLIRPSSDDHILTRMVGAVLVKLDGRYAERIHWADGRMKDFHAIIATGSNNTARYFEHYFGKVPNIIRKSRTSVAILNGQESKAELTALGEDVFRYFGLGCRNVSKVYVPRNFDLDRLFAALFSQKDIIQHNKYANNYDYHKSIYLLNEDNILENGFMLLKESEGLAAPVATLLYERYDDEFALRKQLTDKTEELQCIVSKQDIAFGETQNPSLEDYADGVDTMAFLAQL